MPRPRRRLRVRREVQDRRRHRGGRAKVERALRIENLYAPQNSQLVNHLIQALKAQSLYHRDAEYVIEDDEVKIVDEFTGRIMEGRRWSEGLHQAVEAKEGVRIQEEHLTLATITLQNYFRLYEKLGGMTGTAKTEEKEFVEIYNLHVVEIPTNVPVARLDKHDLVFKTKEGKFEAVARDIKERSEKGQPVLVGTIAVERRSTSPRCYEERRQAHRAEREGARARGGDHRRRRPARRGHDRDEHGGPRRRHQARRRRHGARRPVRPRHRAPRVAPHRQPAPRPLGRQGDPGETRFYLSGEDDLVRLFAGDRIKGIMERFKIPEDQPMEAKILSRQIEGAQKKVEEQNFVMRKNVLKYDDVLNRHRGRIYEQRRQVLEGDDMSEQVKLWIDDLIEDTVTAFTEERVRRGVGSRGADERDRAALPHRDHRRRAREDLGATSRATRSSRSSRPTRATIRGEGGGFGAGVMRDSSGS